MARVRMPNYGTLHVPANTLILAGGKLDLVKAIFCNFALRSVSRHDVDCVSIARRVHCFYVWWVAPSICGYVDTSSCNECQQRHNQTCKLNDSISINIHDLFWTGLFNIAASHERWSPGLLAYRSSISSLPSLPSIPKTIDESSRRQCSYYKTPPQYHKA